MLQNTFLSFPRMPWSSHSCGDRKYSYYTRQEVFATDMLKALNLSLEHDCDCYDHMELWVLEAFVKQVIFNYI